ncbi:hypothetical protein [Thomasclavelia cocleata]|uniref:hypothetical protein n=1 Tax=Thomasclavelia cocleata TaxID=69824 RepID=UPI00272AE109|nr:hypothetical protein [Thomasclavelia cocleata]
MAYKPLLYLNDMEIKNIVEFDDLASTQDGENSGRTPTLSMNRDILGRIMSITVKLGITDKTTGRSILNLLKKPNIKVRFLDSETDMYKTIDCYCVDPKKTLLPGMLDFYQSLEFVLNSNGRYD